MYMDKNKWVTSVDHQELQLKILLKEWSALDYSTLIPLSPPFVFNSSNLSV